MEYNLGSLSQIPLGEGRNFLAGETLVAVFHTRAGVYATQAECPHRRGPLADGLLGGATVICPFHAWKFDLATGEPLLGQCAIQTYPVRLNAEGMVCLTVTESAPLPCTVPESAEIGVSQATVGSAVGPAESA